MQTKLFRHVINRASLTGFCVLFITILAFPPMNGTPNLQLNSNTTQYTTEGRSPLASEYEIHAPLSIYGDAELQTMATTEGWSGNGTADDPIIIENYLITGINDAILLQNTNLHVKITHCKIQPAAQYSSQGINLMNANNLTIEYCEFNYFLRGIYIQYSSQIQIRSNIFEDNAVCISISNGLNLSIMENHFSNSSSVVYSTEMSNVLFQYNTVDGDSEALGTPIPFFLPNSDNITISQNIIQNMQYTIQGVILGQFSTDFMITNNTFHDITAIVFYLVSCQFFTITYNLFHQVGRISQFAGTTDVILKKNTFVFCEDTFYFTQSTSIVIYYNNFLNITNPTPIIDEFLTGILYNNGDLGNYWDHISPNVTQYLVYSFDDIDIYDNHPFNRLIDINLPQIHTTPQSVSYRRILDKSPEITWIISDANPDVLKIYLNDTLMQTTFWSSGNTTLNLADIVEINATGVYNFRFIFIDTDANQASFQFSVTVEDNLISSGMDFVVNNKYYFIGGGAAAVGAIVLLVMLKIKKKK